MALGNTLGARQRIRSLGVGVLLAMLAGCHSPEQATRHGSEPQAPSRPAAHRPLPPAPPAKALGTDARGSSSTAAPRATAPPPAEAAVEEPARGPLFLDVGDERPAVYYPPRDRSGPRPVVVMLHGMCALPEYECPVFRRGATAWAWLLCPAGPTSCRGAGRMWSGSMGKLTGAVDRALEALKQQAADADLGTVVLAGYSLGATAALSMASASRQRFDRLLLLNASLDPAGPLLKRAGIGRVALVAGSRDRSRTRLQSAARRLKHFGLEARFFTLEQTGHYFDGQSESRMVEALRWLGEEL